MDSTQLPPPNLPTDSSGAAGGTPPSLAPSMPASADPAVTPPSTEPTPAVAPTTAASTPQPPIENPSSQPTAFASNTPPQNSPAAAEDQVFHSPIIEGLQQMQTTPFQPAATVASPSTVPSEGTGSAIQQPLNSPLPAEGGNNQPGVPPVEKPGSAPEMKKADHSKSAKPAKDGQGSSGKKPPAKVVGSIFGQLWFRLLLLVGFIAVIGFVGWNFWQSRMAGTSNTATTPTAKITLTYWGLWENDDVIAPLIQKYEGLHPNVTIQYVYQNHRQYRSRLQAAIRQGSGPDIFRFHNTWLPMMQDDLSTAPSDVLTSQEMKNEFYPVVSQDVVKGNQVYGVPLMYDGLALVYNESMLAAANALPPRDWKTLREVAAALTIHSDSRLERSGVAMGTADNVDHFSDILGLLMLQNGAQVTNPTTETAQTALEFYTLFNRTDGDWDNTMPQSTLAFANEEVAMIFVPSWRIHEIRELNPNLKFGVATVPQLSDQRVAWATYWVEGVSKKSSHSKEAWEFITWLSQPEQLRQLASEASKYRGFGELYPRVEMASELSDDPDLAPYLQDALYAQSSYLADQTHDEGLNDQLISYYKDAINSINKNGRAADALAAIAPGVKTVLSKFGVSVSR